VEERKRSQFWGRAETQPTQTEQQIEHGVHFFLYLGGTDMSVDSGGEVEAANGATTTEVNPPGDERGVAGLATPKQTGVITPGSALENSPLPTESPAAGRQLWHPRSTGANSILTELADISPAGLHDIY